MPTTPEDLEAYLARLGIATTTVTHPPLFTVEESRALRGEIPGAHTKNLFLKDKKDAIFLVVALEDTRIDLKRLHQTIGASGRLSFGRPELLAETLGVAPGAVTPFGLINDRPPRVKVILDAALMAHEVINCHPLVNTATTGLTPADLLAFIEATGHTPHIVPVAATDAAKIVSLRGKRHLGAIYAAPEQAPLKGRTSDEHSVDRHRRSESRRRTRRPRQGHDHADLRQGCARSLAP